MTTYTSNNELFTLAEDQTSLNSSGPGFQPGDTLTFTVNYDNPDVEYLGLFPELALTVSGDGGSLSTSYSFPNTVINYNFELSSDFVPGQFVNVVLEDGDTGQNIDLTDFLVDPFNTEDPGPEDLGTIELNMLWQRSGLNSSILRGSGYDFQVGDRVITTRIDDPNGGFNDREFVVNFEGEEIFSSTTTSGFTFTEEHVANPAGLEFIWTYTDDDGFRASVSDVLDNIETIVTVGGGGGGGGGGTTVVTETVEVPVEVEVEVPVEVLVPTPTPDGTLFKIDAMDRKVDKITRFDPGSRFEIGGDELLIYAEGVNPDGFGLEVVRNRKQLKEASRTDVDFVYRKDKGLLYWNTNGDERGYVIKEAGNKFGGRIAKIDFANDGDSLSIVDMVATNEVLA